MGRFGVEDTMESSYNAPEKEVQLDGGICGTKEAHLYIECDCGSKDYAKGRTLNDLGSDVDAEINEELEFQATMDRIRPDRALIFYMNNGVVPQLFKKGGRIELTCGSCDNKFLLDYSLYKKVTGIRMPFLED